jgi:hypothetical protein
MALLRHAAVGRRWPLSARKRKLMGCYEPQFMCSRRRPRNHGRGSSWDAAALRGLPRGIVLMLAPISFSARRNS